MTRLDVRLVDSQSVFELYGESFAIVQEGDALWLEGDDGRLARAERGVGRQVWVHDVEDDEDYELLPVSLSSPDFHLLVGTTRAGSILSRDDGLKRFWKGALGLFGSWETMAAVPHKLQARADLPTHFDEAVQVFLIWLVLKDWCRPRETE